MPTILITGCDYGIGYELARQYADAGWRVHAACLEPSSEEKIADLAGEVRFCRLDVADPGQVQALGADLRGEPIDILLNNAATFAADGPGRLMLPPMDEFARVMRVNAIAPLYVADAFADHVAASEKRTMAFIGTRSGSIGDNTSGGHYAYRCSKTALNMVVKSLSVDLADQGVTAVVIHPGSVATETRAGGQIPVAESVAGIRRVLGDLTSDQTGTFLRYDGGTIEW